MSDDEAVTRAVADLYALDRDAFVSARDEAAAVLRKAGDRTAAAAIKKLGRPTVAAWAVNQLVRANPALIERLTDFGVRLRDAQSALDAGELRALRPDRDALLDEVVHAAATVAATRGQPLSAAAEDDVRATFVAALADPAAAVALWRPRSRSRSCSSWAPGSSCGASATRRRSTTASTSSICCMAGVQQRGANVSVSRHDVAPSPEGPGGRAERAVPADARTDPGQPRGRERGRDGGHAVPVGDDGVDPRVGPRHAARASRAAGRS